MAAYGIEDNYVAPITQVQQQNLQAVVFGNNTNEHCFGYSTNEHAVDQH